MRHIAIIFLLLATLGRPDARAYELDNEPGKLRIQTPHAVWEFTVEIAATPEQQRRGLMGRTALDGHYGMLFVREKPALMKMWMEGTLIPLDLLFIDAKGVIHHITPNAEPRSRDIIAAPTPSLAVLELAGGTAADAKISIGDRVIMEPYFP